MQQLCEGHPPQSSRIRAACDLTAPTFQGEPDIFPTTFFLDRTTASKRKKGSSQRLNPFQSPLVGAVFIGDLVFQVIVEDLEFKIVSQFLSILGNVPQRTAPGKFMGRIEFPIILQRVTSHCLQQFFQRNGNRFLTISFPLPFAADGEDLHVLFSHFHCADGSMGATKGLTVLLKIEALGKLKEQVFPVPFDSKLTVMQPHLGILTIA